MLIPYPCLSKKAIASGMSATQPTKQTYFASVTLYHANGGLGVVLLDSPLSCPRWPAEGGGSSRVRRNFIRMKDICNLCKQHRRKHTHTHIDTEILQTETHTQRQNHARTSANRDGNRQQHSRARNPNARQRQRPRSGGLVIVDPLSVLEQKGDCIRHVCHATH